MKYGYFLAADRSMHGDRALALEASFWWEQEGHAAPASKCGCSIWERDGAKTVRLVVRDLFRNGTWQAKGYAAFDVPNYHVFDLPEPRTATASPNQSEKREK